MANSIYLGGGIKSAFCGGNVKEIWQGTNKLFPSGADKLVIDGLEYRIAQMPDGRIWMCESLQAAQGSAVFYNNDEATYGRNGKNYGRLYNWNDAMAVSSRVEGWHLPTLDEWFKLDDAIGGRSITGTKLKSKTGWLSGNGTDDYGFTAFPAGYLNGSSFTEIGTESDFWSSSERSDTTYANEIYFSNFSSMFPDYASKTEFSFSVRLVKDA